MPRLEEQEFDETSITVDAEIARVTEEQNPQIPEAVVANAIAATYRPVNVLADTVRGGAASMFLPPAISATAAILANIVKTAIAVPISIILSLCNTVAIFFIFKLLSRHTWQTFSRKIEEIRTSDNPKQALFDWIAESLPNTWLGWLKLIRDSAYGWLFISAFMTLGIRAATFLSTEWLGFSVDSGFTVFANYFSAFLSGTTFVFNWPSILQLIYAAPRVMRSWFHITPEEQCLQMLARSINRAHQRGEHNTIDDIASALEIDLAELARLPRKGRYEAMIAIAPERLATIAGGHGIQADRKEKLIRLILGLATQIGGVGFALLFLEPLVGASELKLTFMFDWLNQWLNYRGIGIVQLLTTAGLFWPFHITLTHETAQPIWDMVTSSSIRPEFSASAQRHKLSSFAFILGLSTLFGFTGLYTGFCQFVTGDDSDAANSPFYWRHHNMLLFIGLWFTLLTGLVIHMGGPKSELTHEARTKQITKTEETVNSATESNARLVAAQSDLFVDAFTAVTENTRASVPDPNIPRYGRQ